MGLGKFLKSSSPSRSRSKSPQPRGLDHPPLGFGSPNPDRTYGLNPPGPSTSTGLARGYFYDDAPPAYDQGGSGFNDFATDSKMPVPDNTNAGMVYFPTPDLTPQSTNPSGEDPLRVLLHYDIVIIFDDSYSMLVADNECKKTRWDQAWEALHKLVQEGSKYDRDGIQIHFLNKRSCDATVKSVSDLGKLRKHAGVPDKGAYTPTGDVLEGLLYQYKQRVGNKPGVRGVKKRVFLVITDGVPTDAPEDVIINAAKFYQKNEFPIDQVGIQFIQVGNDLEAKKFLEGLDKNLPRQMGEDRRDLVDTVKSNGVNLNGELLIKALIGGINRRQDRTGETSSVR